MLAYDILPILLQTASAQPLLVALSADGDKTWPHRKDLATGKDSFAYPVALQARDGRIHIVYTSNTRKVIQHAVIEESWLKSR